jgi:NADH-quinone oxidoreductase subunit H
MDLQTLIIGYAVLILKLGVVLAVLLTAAAYLVLFERKFLGRLQIRYGPNRAGPYGLLQPFADTIKMITKEDIVPAEADRAIFLYAPAVVGLTALMMFAVVPFGPDLTLFGREVKMVVADLNVGVLFAFALSSLSVYGIALGGWASNSKYSLLGGIRGAAQMISYELALGLAIVPVVMRAGSFSLVDIVNAQAGLWYVATEPVAFVVFFISAMAESKRIPFDLPEAENELGAGFHTEYSGMRFGLFFLGEYVAMQVLGGLIAVFFLGGWQGPLLPGPVWLGIKIFLVCLVMVWMRGTLPRLRYDQLMNLGWKVLVPISLVNVIVTGARLLW